MFSRWKTGTLQILPQETRNLNSSLKPTPEVDEVLAEIMTVTTTEVRRPVISASDDLGPKPRPPTNFDDRINSRDLIVP